jgi:hypothetical protein
MAGEARAMTRHEREVDHAIADPTRDFKTPMDVVRDPGLDIDEKRKILESWKTDAQLLATAQDENMAGGESSRLQEVVLALEALDAL